jgi:hypothetical protein
MQIIEKKLSSKDKLIDAAITYLSEKGFNGFTATKLTKSANLGYGTFYKYFSSTEDVLEAAIKKTISDRAIRIAEINTQEKNKLIAFVRAVYTIFMDLCHDPSVQWLQEKPIYFCEIYYDLTIKYAKEDAEEVVKNNLLDESYLDNYEIKHKLCVWNLCGSVGAVKQGEDYKVVGSELIRMIMPQGLDKVESNRIHKLVIDEADNK